MPGTRAQRAYVTSLPLREGARGTQRGTVGARHAAGHAHNMEDQGGDENGKAGHGAGHGDPYSAGIEDGPRTLGGLVSIEKYLAQLVISQGPRAGQNFELLRWQQKFLRGAFAPGVQRAACTCGRANGKSGMVAAISTLFLAGPLAQPRGEVVVLASSFGQARDAIGEQVLWFLGGAEALREN